MPNPPPKKKKIEVLVQDPKIKESASISPPKRDRMGPLLPPLNLSSYTPRYQSVDVVCACCISLYRLVKYIKFMIYPLINWSEYHYI